MPVLTMEKKSAPVKVASFPSALSIVASRVKLSAWSIAVLVLVTAATAFLAGRRYPAHHYVAYFAYPMMVDTTTGKACYAAPPKPANAVQDAAYPLVGTANSVDAESPSGPTIPLCGNE